MTALASLLVALLLLVSGHVHFDASTPLQSVTTGNFIEAISEEACVVPHGNAVDCPERQFVIRTGGTWTIEQAFLGDGRAQQIAVHELAHVYDGLDGRVDGSPGHPWSEGHYTKGNVYDDHCMSNRAEYFACESVRTGAIQ